MLGGCAIRPPAAATAGARSGRQEGHAAAAAVDRQPPLGATPEPPRVRALAPLNQLSAHPSALPPQVVDPAAGSVAFRIELTTPACPIKDDFERAVRLLCSCPACCARCAPLRSLRPAAWCVAAVVCRCLPVASWEAFDQHPPRLH